MSTSNEQLLALAQMYRDERATADALRKQLVTADRRAEIVRRTGTAAMNKAAAETGDGSGRIGVFDFGIAREMSKRNLVSGFHLDRIAKGAEVQQVDATKAGAAKRRTDGTGPRFSI
jgi:hypothetical protein